MFARFLALRGRNGWIFGTMLVSSGLSLVASFVLSVDAIALAKNPSAALACNINEVISCGTVGVSWQAHVFGFPNAFLGLVAEPVVITIAVASLTGVRFRRGFMLAAQVIYTLGLVFAYWLFEQAMFSIGALCPWCLLVTLSTTLVFTTLTHVNLRDRNLYLPGRLAGRLAGACERGWDLVIVVAWLVAIAFLVLFRYQAQLFG
jgi:uncharacterized membrane protein